MPAHTPVQNQQFATSFEQDSSQEVEALKKIRAKFWQKYQQIGLPDNRVDTFQFVQLRTFANQRFQKAQMANVLPVGLVECQHARIVFVNGYFRSDLSDITALPKGCVLMSMQQAFKSYSVLLNNRYTKLLKEEDDPFAALNAAMHQDGAFFYLPPNLQLDVPIEIISAIDTAQEYMWVMPRLHLFVGKFTEAKFVTTSQAIQAEHCFYNAVYDFELEDEAKVSFTHTHLAQTANHSFSFDAFRANLKRHSQFRGLQLTDSEKSRRDWRVSLVGDGAEADLSGIWFLDKQKETHTNVVIEHREPHTKSLQLFKGVLKDSAVSSFQGKIYVEKRAQKTTAYQINNNLILSNQATANSKPNLEIFADDVKASHGATVGQLDPEQLFYLKTRGFSENDAKSLLVRGFCEEVLAKIEISSLHKLAEQQLQQFCALERF